MSWGYDCGGVGKGIVGRAVWNGGNDIKLCFRSYITSAEAVSVSWHELQHAYQFKVADANGITIDVLEERLGQLYDTSGLRKKTLSYPHLEIAADCGARISTGHDAVNAYTWQCDGARTDAAIAIQQGNLP